jgi:type III pantothenate kinase
MLLAINANNTNIKFALFDDGAVVEQWRIHTDPGRTADEYAVWLTQLMALRGIERDGITGAAIASVVPQTMFDLRGLCQRHLGHDPLVVGEPGVKLGIEVLIERPQDVGADRLCNAVGAHRLYPEPSIVIDFGTATTFDVVDGRGNYCGGVIAPGINLGLEALHVATAKLPRIVVSRPKKVIGTDTLSAMQSGVYWGYVGLIEGLVKRIEDEWGRSMLVISTGGLAPLFADVTKVIKHLAPDVTMQGLAEIYRRNRPSGKAAAPRPKKDKRK